MWLVVVFVLLLGVTFAGPIKTAGAKLWKAGAGLFGEEKKESNGQFYTCGMHPWVILPEPGDCPICHMELTPLDPAKFTGEVAIDPVVTQNIGIRVAPVEMGPITQTIRTVGTVGTDETRVRDINLKVDGWIEKLHVDYLGAPVAVDQPLFDLYSPDLYAAQSELLSALGGRRSLPSNDRLVESARTRLKFLDVSDAQIEALIQRGEPGKTMTILSPYEGVVVEKQANEGMHVAPGTKVFRIADLSRVWVSVTVYEYQLPSVKLGQRAIMTLPYAPGRDFEGTVTYIDPTLDPRTREVQVRLEFDNADLTLKPGMFASIYLENTSSSMGILTSRSAVLTTGARSVAFVSLGEGKFEPRAVKVGLELDDGRIEILEGLKPGEQVVVSGQFLLDSEAKTREALARMIEGDLAADQKPVVVAVAEVKDVLPAAAQTALGQMLDAYLTIADRLASDSTDGVADSARSLAAHVAELVATEVPGAPHFWHMNHAADLEALATAVADADGLADIRTAFRALSEAMSALVGATGVPASHEAAVHVLHCPMYMGGSVWLQGDSDVRNPFYGSEMLTCSDSRKALPAAAAAAP